MVNSDNMQNFDSKFYVRILVPITVDLNESNENFLCKLYSDTPNWVRDKRSWNFYSETFHSSFMSHVEIANLLLSILQS